MFKKPEDIKPLPSGMADAFSKTLEKQGFKASELPVPEQQEESQEPEIVSESAPGLDRIADQKLPPEKTKMKGKAEAVQSESCGCGADAEYDSKGMCESCGMPHAEGYSESFSPKEVKMAIGVASDKRYAGGNMTGAVKAIDKIKRGLSSHPQVAAVLKRQNESLDKQNSKDTKKKFGDLDDKDIDNDGDTDSSDKYLHMRRAAIAKAIASRKEKSEAREVDPADIDLVATDKDKASAKMNIIMQLRKSVDVDGNLSIKFADGKAQKIPVNIMKIALAKVDSFRKPANKERLQLAMGKSYKDMIDAVKTMREEYELMEAPFEVNYDDSPNWGEEEAIKYGRSQGYREFGVVGTGLPHSLVLFQLNSFDKKYTKDVKLKSGETIFRYASRGTVLGKMIPLVKINIDRGLLYFLTEESFNGEIEEPVFKTRAEKLKYVRVLTPKHAKIMGWKDEVEPYDESVEQVDEGIVSTGIAKVKAGHYNRKANKSYEKAQNSLGYGSGKSIAKGTSDEDDFSKNMKKGRDYEAKSKKFASYNGNRNEDVEQVDEISKGLASRYVDKARTDIKNQNKKMDDVLAKPSKQGLAKFDKAARKQDNRFGGINRALTKMREDVEQVDEAEVPSGMKFMAAFEYKGTKHTYYRKGNKMSDSVVVHIDGKEWKEFASFPKAKAGALAHIKSMAMEEEVDKVAIQKQIDQAEKYLKTFFGNTSSIKMKKFAIRKKVDALKAKLKED